GGSRRTRVSWRCASEAGLTTGDRLLLGEGWRGRKLASRRSDHSRKRGARMALSLRDVQRDPIANRALNELMHLYTAAEEKSRLVLTKTVGDMKLFLYDLDDLHQLDFVHNQQVVREIERLRVRSSTIDQQRESWKVRALMERRSCSKRRPKQATR